MNKKCSKCNYLLTPSEEFCPQCSTKYSDISRVNDPSDFSGEKTLDNDAFKLFLSKKYKIKKNDLLNKFEVNNSSLFDTFDDALLFALDQECNITENKVDLLFDQKLNIDSNNKIEEKSKYHSIPFLILFGVIALIPIIIAFISYEDRSKLEKSAVSIKPSFECSEAKNSTELKICNDSNLAKLDVENAELYKKAKKTNSTQAKQQLNNSVKNRYQCGDNFNCIKSNYQQSIDAFKSIINGNPISTNQNNYASNQNNNPSQNYASNNNQTKSNFDSTGLINLKNEGTTRATCIAVASAMNNAAFWRTREFYTPTNDRNLQSENMAKADRIERFGKYGEVVEKRLQYNDYNLVGPHWDEYVQMLQLYPALYNQIAQSEPNRVINAFTYCINMYGLNK